MLRPALTTIIFFALVACNTAPPKTTETEPLPPKIEDIDKSKLYIQFPAEKEILFLGKLDVDSADKVGGGMMYPGYDAASFLAAVLTHAAIQSGVKSKEEQRRREEANQILSKYEPILDEINSNALIGHTYELETNDHVFVTLNLFNSEVSGKRNLYLAKVEPVYYISQNERSLVLSNKITFIGTKHPVADKKPFVVEYVSSPNFDDDPNQYWSTDDYKNFVFTAKHLFKETIRLALEMDLSSESHASKSSQTIRYYESGKKKVERGQVINNYCDRIVFITLRGAIKSVPLFEPSVDCAKSKDEILAAGLDGSAPTIESDKLTP